MAWDNKVPFREGTPVTYSKAGYTRGIEWRDNEPFEDTLTFKGYSRGNSAARLTFASETLGETVEMFLSDAAGVVPLLRDGQISGVFKFTKKGQNFGICLVKHRKPHVFVVSYWDGDLHRGTLVVQGMSVQSYPKASDLDSASDVVCGALVDTGHDVTNVSIETYYSRRYSDESIDIPTWVPVVADVDLGDKTDETRQRAVDSLFEAGFDDSMVSGTRGRLTVEIPVATKDLNDLLARLSVFRKAIGFRPFHATMVTYD